MVNWKPQDISRFENASFNPGKSQTKWSKKPEVLNPANRSYGFPNSVAFNQDQNYAHWILNHRHRGIFIYNHGTISILAAYTGKHSLNLRYKSDAINKKFNEGALFLFYVSAFWHGANWIIIDIFSSDWIWDFLTVNAGPDVLNVCTFGGIVVCGCSKVFLPFRCFVWLPSRFLKREIHERGSGTGFFIYIIWGVKSL